MLKNISLATLLASTSAGDINFWKQRTVYQLLTDRYSRSNGDKSSCNDLHNYCGGTFKGIQDNLDYI